MMVRRWLFLAAALGLSSAALSANVVVPAEFKEIVADASLIVRGRVTDVRGVVTADRVTESIATIAVDRVLKGTASAFVSVLVPGGTIGRYRTMVVGAPVLKPGQQAVFFLKRDGRNNLRPVGLSMGIFQVRADEATGAAVVNPPISSGQTADVGPIVRGDARRKPMAVPSFESLVSVEIGRAHV